LFAPTDHAASVLECEGISGERIFLTGNTIIDAVLQNREIAHQKSTILDDLSLQGTEFAVVTLHRESNVDTESRFATLLDALGSFAAEMVIPIIYPIHPRARKTSIGYKTLILHCRMPTPQLSSQTTVRTKI
jgi:UDP-N-acetylglucosamine 2-epimerase (non-hydrolysing)